MTWGEPIALSRHDSTGETLSTGTQRPLPNWYFQGLKKSQCALTVVSLVSAAGSSNKLLCPAPAVQSLVGRIDTLPRELFKNRDP